MGHKNDQRGDQRESQPWSQEQATGLRAGLSTTHHAASSSPATRQFIFTME